MIIEENIKRKVIKNFITKSYEKIRMKFLKLEKIADFKYKFIWSDTEFLP